MKNYIIEKKSREKKYSFAGIEVSIFDPVPDDINVKGVLEKVTALVPSPLMRFINKINVGQFEILNKRDLDALYKNKTIYLTNLQKSDYDMLDDIIHEIAHSVEEEYFDLIYSDEEIRKEFLSKREKLREILENQGYKIDPKKYQSVSYDIEFDMFLYEEVGYDKLASLTSSLFLSPYAATSLREYFANGFENIFLSEKAYQILRRLSPKLFKKLVKLISLEENY